MLKRWHALSVTAGSIDDHLKSSIDLLCQSDSGGGLEGVLIGKLREVVTVSYHRCGLSWKAAIWSCQGFSSFKVVARRFGSNPSDMASDLIAELSFRGAVIVALC